MIRPFSAWKVGAAHYLPGLLLGVFCLYLAYRGYPWGWTGTAVFLLYGFFALFFFRDPPRVITARAADIVSPADGAVVAIDDLSATPHYAGPCRRISIFLSILSVHVNRAPFDGVVKDVQYCHGQFKNAMNPKTSECNESNVVWLDTPRGPVTVRQIAGVIARRIVCDAQVGEALAKGERFGMIRFGSRTELYLPPNTEVCVRMKDRVKAGTTIVGRFS